MTSPQTTESTTALPHERVEPKDTASAPFVARHIGPRPADVEHMLQTLGYDSLEALVDTAVPAGIRQPKPLELPAPLTESAVLEQLREIAGRNVMKTQMIGQGFSDTVTPGVILRKVLENPAWYTAYTPYQPEISQGRLEALLNYQTMVQDLTGLDIANASLLDEASAAAEAVLLMHRANRRRTDGVTLLDADLFPQTLSVVRLRAEAVGIDVRVADLSAGIPEDVRAEVEEKGLCGVVLQQPGDSGRIHDHAAVIAQAKEAGALVTVAADILSLALITPPGEQGADIAVGSTQRFGVPLFFGGPHAAYMAVKEGLQRSMPGRLVGVSHDDAGKPAYRLALQTREQHIRREKATSNICTAQALLAIVASMYAVYHGPAGLRAIAERVHGHALALADRLRGAELDVEHPVFFDTVRVAVPGTAAEVVARADALGVNLWAPDGDHVQVACDETTTDAHLDAVVEAFVPGSSASGYFVSVGDLPAEHRRTTEYLTHPVFHEHRSETQMMRYLRTLADKDLALDRTMIPLGSCTMKLNAAIQMEPISWPEYAGIHPFAPAAQTGGYDELISTLEANLAEITGYAAVSVQPNAGSQGEFAGLLAIRNYHRSRDEAGRDICLIPASAHGTNAASAAMAGMRVVVVATADDGEILLDDLRAKLEQHGPQVAAIMITYPSTHGVYEDTVREVCDLVHAAGGQVYIDGANLNALVGLAKPGQFGGDVSHLNLHKTFCIPHGGGGPGVGPVGVAEHLVPFLPGAGSAPVSAAPAGSAGILPIPYAYVALMGPDGLRRATETAVVSANYLAVRLRDAFPVLFTGPGGLVAHECILDLRPLTAQTGVTAEDVAKRLMDYGFHAPTLSFPVPGTLMVEPTESEDLAEIDRFVDAMLAIRAEIDQVADGTWALAESPLRNAPHSAASVVSDAWDKPYPRELAAYPVAALRAAKYWPPVRRIDGAKGDRNLVCSCPPIEAYADDVAAPTETTLAHAAVGA